MRLTAGLLLPPPRMLTAQTGRELGSTLEMNKGQEQNDNWKC
jgi:hypothetical protein